MGGSSAWSDLSVLEGARAARAAMAATLRRRALGGMRSIPSTFSYSSLLRLSSPKNLN